MPMPKGAKIDKTSPEFLQRKAEREAKAVRAKKQNAALLEKAASPHIAEIQATLDIDPVLENSLNDPKNVHVSIHDSQYTVLIKRWTLTKVPYIIIYQILYEVFSYLKEKRSKFAIDLVSWQHFITKENVGAVRTLVYLYVCEHTELFIDIDLQYYVNQALRHHKHIYDASGLAALFGSSINDRLHVKELSYDSQVVSQLDIKKKVTEFFKQENILQQYAAIYEEFVGQNRINNCYSSIRPNFAWTLDLSYFKFTSFGIWLFVALDLATRKIMVYEFYTPEETPSGGSLFQALEKGLKKHEVFPNILHTDLGSYFSGEFDDKLRELYPEIQLSKTRYGLSYKQNKDHQNQAVEAFFFSFKRMVINELGDLFWNNCSSPQKAINRLREQVRIYNEAKIHRILKNPPDKDYFNKIILDCIRCSIKPPEEQRSLTSTEVKDMLKESNPIDPIVIKQSDLPSNSEDLQEIIFLDSAGKIYNQQQYQAEFKKDPSEAELGILLKQKIPYSSRIVLDSLKNVQTIQQIIKFALEQFPKEVFDNIHDMDINEFLRSETVFNAFYFSIKTHILTEKENIYTPLALYLQNMLPNLIRGPGKYRRYDTNYLQFIDIQFALDDIINAINQIHVQYILRVQFIYLNKVNEVNSTLQMVEHKRTQDLILDSFNQLKEKTTSMQQSIDNLESQLKSATQEIERRNKRDDEARLVKEKRKKYAKLPPREPITTEEFYKLMNHCNNMIQVDNKPSVRFKANFMKISYFLLMSSGMRVSNLMEVKNHNITSLMADNRDNVVDVNLIKSTDRQTIRILVGNSVHKSLIQKEPYYLKQSFSQMLEHVQDFLRGQGKSCDIQDLPFACAFSNPATQMSREYLTRTLNEGLVAINVDKFNKPLSTPAKTSHSFRVRIISQITEEHGLEIARDFVNHSDIKSTQRYNRSRISDKLRRDITSSLFTRSKKNVGPEQAQDKNKPALPDKPDLPK